VKPLAIVGKKLISLLACSILKIYKGVFPTKEPTVENSTRDTTTTPVTAIPIFFLFMISPPFLWDSQE
jgi:hypothetical protein